MVKLLFSSLLIFCFSLKFMAGAQAGILTIAENFSVRVKATIEHSFYEDKTGTQNGAGFLVSAAQGWIATNAHVTGRGTGTVQTSFKGERFIDAEVIYVDPLLDLALVQIDSKQIPKNAKEAKLQCEQFPLQGREVAAFGHPHGLDYSASRGIVSTKRTYDGLDWIQTDAAINPGNSGGPLIDIQTGKVIGVNAMSLKETEGLNFAVPVSHLCKIVQLLLLNIDPLPPQIPFSFGTNFETDEHLIITSIAKNMNGLSSLVGYRVVEVNGKKVDTPADISSNLRGETGSIIFKFKREEKTIIKKVKISPMQNPLSRSYIVADGALISLDPFQDRRNVENYYYIHSVGSGSGAESAGIEKYSQLIAINGKTAGSLEDIFEKLKDKQKLSMIFRRWASADNLLYEFFEVEYEPSSVSFFEPKCLLHYKCRGKT